MGEGFAPTTPDEDDFAAMLASLEPRLDRRTIARALGVRTPELDLIAIGHAPAPEAAARLKMLYGLAERTDGDLHDPRTLLASLGLPADGDLLIPVKFVPRLRTLIVAFVVADAFLALGVVLVFALR